MLLSMLKHNQKNCLFLCRVKYKTELFSFSKRSPSIKCFHICGSQQQYEPMIVFDRHAKLLQKERALRNPEVQTYGYLKKEVGARLANRIFDVKKDLKIGLELGCGFKELTQFLSEAPFEHLYLSDFSSKILQVIECPSNIKCTKVVIDEEERFPFESETFDLVISNLNLHWVNNLPFCMKEIFRILKKDGVFLASIFGGESLFELRSSFVLAELEREGGFSPHVSPFTDIRDISSLLSNAGFIMQTIDIDEIRVGYPSLFEIMDDLQGMGENNAAINRKLRLNRDTMLAAAAVYNEMYRAGEGVNATFQIIYMIGWRPDPQQQVSQSVRGSGEISLKDLHRLEEMVKKSGMEGRVKFMENLSNSDKTEK